MSSLLQKDLILIMIFPADGRNSDISNSTFQEFYSNGINIIIECLFRVMNRKLRVIIDRNIRISTQAPIADPKPI